MRAKRHWLVLSLRVKRFWIRQGMSDLRGGSVLDWRRLNVSSLAEGDAILRVNGFDPENEGDRARLREIRLSAIDYLERNFEFRFAPEIVNAESASNLMLLAAGGEPLRRRQACTVLKIMHILHHVNARELKSRLNISDRALYHLVEEKTTRAISAMKAQGYPIFNFKDFIRRHPRISKMIPELQVDLMHEDEIIERSNPDTSSKFKTVNFIVDLPICLDERHLEVWPPGIKLPSRVVHVLSEFQIVDQASNIENRSGDASHDRYKARRITKAKERLLDGGNIRSEKTIYSQRQDRDVDGNPADGLQPWSMTNV